MRVNHPQGGQTLFELTITLCILSILLSIGMNHFSHLVKQERGRVAINRMVMAAQEVRHLALSHRSAATLCPAVSEKTCDGKWGGRLVVFSGRAGSQSTVLASTYAALEQGSIEWRSFRQDNFLEMQGNGLTLAQNGTFVYCPDDKDVHYARALIINKSGRARLAEDLDGDGIRDLRKGEPVSCR
jgi:type IV fimbrial biogenesis protein FimT